MPWQQLVLDVAHEIDPETGYFAYREVVVTVPRQSGKTGGLIFPVEVDRCAMWGDVQRVIYTAQTGSDARKKLLEDQAPTLEKSPLGKIVRKIHRAQGNEGIIFRNGSRISVAASSQESGHGFTVDLGVLDECWRDEDDRREQALLPAMVTRPWAQLWLTSTQGTDRSVYLNRKVDAGRHAAATDRGTGIAYFEWSIPPDEDIDDPDVWWEYMPALGWTISEAAVAHARETMEEAEFRRAYGNQPTKTEHDRVIPLAVWEAVQDARAEVQRTEAPPRYGVDVSHDRTSAAIVASDGEVIELIDHREGTGWILERVQALCEKWGGSIVIDGGGPAASLGDELEQAGLFVDRLTSASYAAACARLYDSIADRRVRVRPSAALDIATAGAAKRPVGDRFVWSRATSAADVTPLVAATLAYGSLGGGIIMYISGEEDS